MKYRVHNKLKWRGSKLKARTTYNAAPNPLKTDPTRTGKLRRKLEKELRRRFALLKGRIVKLIVTDDAFGLRGKVHNPFELHPTLNYDPDQPRDDHGRWQGAVDAVFAKLPGILQSAARKAIYNPDAGTYAAPGKHISIGKGIDGPDLRLGIYQHEAAHSLASDLKHLDDVKNWDTIRRLDSHPQGWTSYTKQGAEDFAESVRYYLAGKAPSGTIHEGKTFREAFPNRAAALDRIFQYAEKHYTANYDPDQPRDAAGRWDAGGGGSESQPSSQTAEAKAKGILAFARNLPSRVLTGIRDKVATHYAKLSTRYGPKYAKAIIGAALAGVPVPLPGASFVTAAPMIALAELHRYVSKPKAQPAAVSNVEDVYLLNDGWVTLESGQHVYIGEEGEVQPHGPDIKSVAAAGPKVVGQPVHVQGKHGKWNSDGERLDNGPQIHESIRTNGTPEQLAADINKSTLLHVTGDATAVQKDGLRPGNSRNNALGAGTYFSTDEDDVGNTIVGMGGEKTDVVTARVTVKKTFEVKNLDTWEADAVRSVGGTVDRDGTIRFGDKVVKGSDTSLSAMSARRDLAQAALRTKGYDSLLYRPEGAHRRYALGGHQVVVFPPATANAIGLFPDQVCAAAQQLLDDLYREFGGGADAPTLNTRWALSNDPDTVKAFKEWLQEQTDELLTSEEVQALLEEVAGEAFGKGLARSYDDVKAGERAVTTTEGLPFFQGQRDEWLRTTLGDKPSQEKIDLLAQRSFTDLEGVTDTMAVRIQRELIDGFANGDGPEVIARALNKEVDDIGIDRALTIARTEVVRAHAEGQLEAMEKLGVSEVGVEVEFSTAGDDLVCPECESLEGTTYPVEEAHGIIPVHPRCRCAFIPANVGEDKKDEEPTENYNQEQQRDERGRWSSGDSESGLDKAVSYRAAPGTLSLTAKGYANQEEAATVQAITKSALSSLSKFPGLKAHLDAHPLTDVALSPRVDENHSGLYQSGRVQIATDFKQATGPLRTGKDSFAVDLSLSGALRHEIGHHLVMSGNTGPRWQEWKGIYGDGKEMASVSKYAGVNAEEGLAEAVSAYTHPDYKSGTLPKQVESFLRGWLGKRSK